MTRKSYDDDVMARAVQAVLSEELGALKASQVYGLNNSTLRIHVKAARKGKEAPGKTVSMPVFPDDDVDALQILDHMERRFEQRLKSEQAKHWFAVKVGSNAPFGLATVGDPHIGSNGCNIPLLRRDAALLAKTDGVGAINIGDTTDNWQGKLLRLYADNDVSKQTERRLARWFLEDAGIPWMMWLLGNHDNMDGGFATYLRTIGATSVPMIDWQAKFRLVFPNGRELRCNFAHNHKGTSIYNPLHGQKREHLWHGADMADLIVAGHHHVAASTQEESQDGRIVTLARARGYKWLDDHATHHGFRNNEHGASLLFVIDPTTENPAKLITPFLDLEAGLDFLKWMRRDS